MPVPYNPFSEKMLPDVQREPPLVWLEAISPCPVAGCLGEEVNFQVAKTSFQGVVRLLRKQQVKKLQTSAYLFIFIFNLDEY